MSIELIVALLGTGGLAMVATLVNAWRTYKDGSESDKRTMVQFSEDARIKAESERDSALTLYYYWLSRAAALEHTLMRDLGPEKMPKFPDPPKQSFLFKEDDESIEKEK